MTDRITEADLRCVDALCAKATEMAENAYLIASAYEWLPRLAAEVRRLRAVKEKV